MVGVRWEKLETRWEPQEPYNAAGIQARPQKQHLLLLWSYCPEISNVGFLPIPLGTDFRGGKSQHQMVLGQGQAPGHCLLCCAVGWAVLGSSKAKRDECILL